MNLWPMNGATGNASNLANHVAHVAAGGEVEPSVARYPCPQHVDPLIGHDGWEAARLGDFANSDVILNDYALIFEFQFWIDAGVLDQERFSEVLNAFGDQATKGT